MAMAMPEEPQHADWKHPTPRDAAAQKVHATGDINALRFSGQGGKTLSNFCQQGLCQKLICIQAQHPFGVVWELVERPVELLGLRDEGVRQHARALRSGYLHGSIGRSAIHDHAAIGDERHAAKRPCDVALFVLGEDDDSEGQGGLFKSVRKDGCEM